jgi:hypothetical protein
MGAGRGLSRWASSVPGTGQSSQIESRSGVSLRQCSSAGTAVVSDRGALDESTGLEWGAGTDARFPGCHCQAP